MNQGTPERFTTAARFSWRRLIVWTLLSLIGAVGCAWMALRMGVWFATRADPEFAERLAKAERQRGALVALGKRGYGSPGYDYQYAWAQLWGESLLHTTPPLPGPAWQRVLFGVDFVADIVSYSPPVHSTDADMVHVGAFRKLRSLTLGCCHEITDTGLAHIARLTEMEHLDLYECIQVTDGGLTYLEGMSNLKILNLSWCDKVGDAGLAHLSGLTQMRCLDLNGTNVTDGGLANLRGMRAIEQLGLTWCDKVTDAGLEHLKGLTKLKTLGLEDASSWLPRSPELARPIKVTRQGIARLQEALPKCTIIWDKWPPPHLESE